MDAIEGASGSSRPKYNEEYGGQGERTVRLVTGMPASFLSRAYVHEHEQINSVGE